MDFLFQKVFRMRLLDRYVLRSFVEPFIICFAAFLGILLIFDLNDNLSDFLSSKVKWSLIGMYYVHQLPHFVLLSMPIGVLLAMLYSLSRMSRSNEIISMLTAGRSVLRVLRPLFFCGLITSGICLWLNYELAPRSAAIQKTDMERITKGDKRADQLSVIESLLAKDRLTNRIWFVREVRHRKDENKRDSELLEDVNITQLDNDGKPNFRWQSQRALYDPKDMKWVLHQGRKLGYDKDGGIVGDIEDWSQDAPESPRSARSINNWRETPYRLVSTTLNPDQMGVPELDEFLQYNADFPALQLAPYWTNLQYRWALPCSCFAVAMIAAPLGIIYSRRAVLASVAASIFIFFGYIFLMFLMLALGKGSYVPPWVAAWSPDAALGLIGCYLLYLRSTNRELPSLKFGFK